MSTPDVDYHIELSSMREFANSNIFTNSSIPLSITDLYENMKRAVISSGIAPFLQKPQAGTSDPYYEKYLRLDKELELDKIPDYFSHDENFFDLDQKLNINIDNVDFEVFEQLFFVRLLQLEFYHEPIKVFFQFQLYDNFYGNKEAFASFLKRLLLKNNASIIFKSVLEKIKQWAFKNLPIVINEDFISPNSDQSVINIPSKNIETVTKVFAAKQIGSIKRNNWDQYLQSTQGKKIPGKFTDEEILNYFSFLFQERNSNKIPFLKEENVISIFSTGLLIPKNPLENKLQIYTDAAHPRRMIEYAIHLFYVKNSFSQRDKDDYVIFFGHYFETYAEALKSKSHLRNLASNINGKQSVKCRINFQEYLPLRFRN